MVVFHSHSSLLFYFNAAVSSVKSKGSLSRQRMLSFSRMFTFRWINNRPCNMEQHHQPAQQAFLCCLGEKNEERESKTASRFISRAVNTESPLPRYFFAPKPNGNACYAGYTTPHICLCNHPLNDLVTQHITHVMFIIA